MTNQLECHRVDRGSATGRGGPAGMTPQEDESRSFSRPHAGYDVVALAASAGGLKAFKHVLAGLPAGFPAAVLVAQHRASDYPSYLPELLQPHTVLQVRQAEQDESPLPGTVYVCPPGRQ